MEFEVCWAQKFRQLDKFLCSGFSVDIHWNSAENTVPLDTLNTLSRYSGYSEENLGYFIILWQIETSTGKATVERRYPEIHRISGYLKWNYLPEVTGCVGGFLLFYTFSSIYFEYRIATKYVNSRKSSLLFPMEKQFFVLLLDPKPFQFQRIHFSWKLTKSYSTMMRFYTTRNQLIFRRLQVFINSESRLPCNCLEIQLRSSVVCSYWIFVKFAFSRRKSLKMLSKIFLFYDFWNYLCQVFIRRLMGLCDVKILFQKRKCFSRFLISRNWIRRHQRVGNLVVKMVIFGGIRH